MKKIVSFLAFFLVAILGQGQQTYIMYGFRALPQHTMLNPAMQGEHNVSIGLPVISRLEFNLSNSPFGANLADASSTFSQELISSIENMTDEEVLYFRNRIDLLYVGFHAGKGYWSLGSYQETEFAFRYPTPLLKMAILGNAPYLNQTLDMSYTNMQAQSLSVYHLGYSHQFENLNIGARFKVINGIAGGRTQMDKFDLRFEEGDLAPFTTTLNSSFAVYTSGLDSTTLSDAGNNYLNTYKAHKNIGYAFDFGFEYELGKRFSFSGSVLDLGFVNWKTNLKSYHSTDVSITTEGPLFTVGVDDDFGVVLENFADSLIDMFDIQEREGIEYKSDLFAKINLAASYHINEKHELMLVGTRTSVFDVPMQSLALNYYGRLSDQFSIRVGYGLFNGQYNNFNAGFSMGKNFQFYVLADFLQYAVDVTSMNKTNVAFGFNVNLGTKDKKLKSNENGKEPKKEKDPKEQNTKPETGATEEQLTPKSVGTTSQAGAATGATTTTEAVVGAAAVTGAAVVAGEIVEDKKKEEIMPDDGQAAQSQGVDQGDAFVLTNESVALRAKLAAFLPAILAKLRVQ